MVTAEDRDDDVMMMMMIAGWKNIRIERWVSEVNEMEGQRKRTMATRDSRMIHGPRAPELSKPGCEVNARQCGFGGV